VRGNVRESAAFEVCELRVVLRVNDLWKICLDCSILIAGTLEVKTETATATLPRDLGV
jgi:hypothetical protein